MTKQTKTYHSTSCIYFLGMIGAATFWIGESTSFGLGVLAALKSLVWPAFMVYDALEYLAV